MIVGTGGDSDTKWFGELFPSDEWMQSRLLRCPSRDWVQVQKALAKVNERRPIVQL